VINDKSEDESQPYGKKGKKKQRMKLLVGPI
jgi:hypothetical protein